MCYRKKILRNPVSLEHRTGFDKPFIQAPCCSCPSCRNVKNFEWLVRAFYEFEDNHRQCFFVTLDFDDEHLPRYKGKPCFDSELMKAFLGRLRHSDVGSFRYFYATDNQGLLKRPHYHIMILPEKDIDKVSFFKCLQKAWWYGSHEDVELLPSVGQSKIQALKYVSGYVSKDITLSLEDDLRDFPKRYKHRVQPSKHFGEQPLKDGRITKEMLLEGRKLSLPIGKNGVLVQLPVPRYYEMKLAYDYTWHSDLMKADLKKNDFGIALAKVRHNGRYVYYIKSLFSSRLDDLSEFYFPSNATYNIPDWYNVVTTALEDMDDFKEYVWLRPFLTTTSCGCFLGLFRDHLHGEYIRRPNWSFYSYVCDIFDRYHASLDLVKCQIETEKLIVRAKKRALAKLQRNPGYAAYLQRKNFDFSKLIV